MLARPPVLPAPSIFGSELRTRLLFLVAVLGQTYPAELSRYTGTPISSVQRALDGLEREGLIASRQLAVRTLTLNPLYPAAKELRDLLLRLAQGYPQYQQIKESHRSRPRRRGKQPTHRLPSTFHGDRSASAEITSESSRPSSVARCAYES